MNGSGPYEREAVPATNGSMSSASVHGGSHLQGNGHKQSAAVAATVAPSREEQQLAEAQRHMQKLQAQLLQQQSQLGSATGALQAGFYSSYPPSHHRPDACPRLTLHHRSK